MTETIDLLRPQPVVEEMHQLTVLVIGKQKELRSARKLAVEAIEQRDALLSKIGETSGTPDMSKLEELAKVQLDYQAKIKRVHELRQEVRDLKSAVRTIRPPKKRPEVPRPRVTVHFVVPVPVPAPEPAASKESASVASVVPRAPVRRVYRKYKAEKTQTTVREVTHTVPPSMTSVQKDRISATGAIRRGTAIMSAGDPLCVQNGEVFIRYVHPESGRRSSMMATPEKIAELRAEGRLIE